MIVVTKNARVKPRADGALTSHTRKQDQSWCAANSLILPPSTLPLYDRHHNTIEAMCVDTTGWYHSQSIRHGLYQICRRLHPEQTQHNGAKTRG